MKNTKYIKFFIIFLFFLLIFFMPFLISKTIKIRKIICASQFGACDKLMESELSLNGNYFDTKEAIKKKLNANVRVSSYLIQFKFPDILKIDLVLKEPWGSIYSDGVYHFVTDEGVVIFKNNESNLISLEADSLILQNGNKINSDLLNSLKLLEKLNYMKGIKTGRIVDNQLLVKIEDVSVRFPMDGDVDYLSGAVRLIFSRLNEKLEGFKMEDIKEIDLRFKDPVIRLKQNG